MNILPFNQHLFKYTNTTASSSVLTGKVKTSANWGTFSRRSSGWSGLACLHCEKRPTGRSWRTWEQMVKLPIQAVLLHPWRFSRSSSKQPQTTCSDLKAAHFCRGLDYRLPAFSSHLNFPVVFWLTQIMVRNVALKEKKETGPNSCNTLPSWRTFELKLKEELSIDDFLRCI